MALDSLPWTPPDSGFYATDAYTDFAVKRVREHDPSAPFFLYLAFTAPHWPLHVPEESVEPYYGTYAAGGEILRQERYARMQSLGVIDSTYALPAMDDDTPAWQAVRDSHDWQRRMEVYAGMVSRIDAGVGRLVEILEATGQFDNTLLFFLSDNGGSPEVIDGRGLQRAGTPIGQPGSYLAYDRPWSQLSNVPYRKYKAWVDEGHRGGRGRGRRYGASGARPISLTRRGSVRRFPACVLGAPGATGGAVGAESYGAKATVAAV